MKLPIRIVSGLMGVLLLYAVVVQFNDPDPIRWSIMYLSAAAVAFLAAANRLRGWMGAPVAVVALGWAAYWATGVIGQQPLFDEEGREMLGLTIAGVWSALISAAAWQREAKPRDAGKAP